MKTFIFKDSLEQENVINALIQDEYEAIDGYNNAIEQFNDNANVKAVLEHIKEEELEHIDELRKLITTQIKK